MILFAVFFTLLTILNGNEEAYYVDTPKERVSCEFGRNPRSFDKIKVVDCSCNNPIIQYKLAEFASNYLIVTGILSANRNEESSLRDKAIAKFIDFSFNFYDDNIFYKTSTVASDGPEWNSLDEYIFVGNDEYPPFIDLVLDFDTTFLTTTPHFIITDCQTKYDEYNNKEIEVVTLSSLYTVYARPDDVGLSDQIHRQFGTVQFTKKEKDDGYRYAATSSIYEGTPFSIDNAKIREGTDTQFSTFDLGY
eukprot:515491_1